MKAHEIIGSQLKTNDEKQSVGENFEGDQEENEKNLRYARSRNDVAGKIRAILNPNATDNDDDIDTKIDFHNKALAALNYNNSAQANHHRRVLKKLMAQKKKSVGEGYGKPWMKIASKVGLLPKDNEADNDTVYKNWRKEVGTDAETTRRIVDPNDPKLPKPQGRDTAGELALNQKQARNAAYRKGMEAWKAYEAGKTGWPRNPYEPGDNLMDAWERGAAAAYDASGNRASI